LLRAQKSVYYEVQHYILADGKPQYERNPDFTGITANMIF
jgi:hypothetical protein